VIGGHYQLAADLVRDLIFAAEVDHLPDPGHCQARLAGTRFVVEAGVQHARVVPGLVATDAALLFKEGDAGAGEPLAKPVSSCQTDDAAADDRKGTGTHWEP